MDLVSSISSMDGGRSHNHHQSLAREVQEDTKKALLDHVKLTRGVLDFARDLAEFADCKDAAGKTMKEGLATLLKTAVVVVGTKLPDVDKLVEKFENVLSKDASGSRLKSDDKLWGLDTNRAENLLQTLEAFTKVEALLQGPEEAKDTVMDLLQLVHDLVSSDKKDEALGESNRALRQKLPSYIRQVAKGLSPESVIVNNADDKQEASTAAAKAEADIIDRFVDLTLTRRERVMSLLGVLVEFLSK